MRKALALRADELATVVDGRLVAGPSEALVEGVSIDSRRVARGEVFVAIRGERFNGHRFVDEAVQRGAVGMIVSEGADARREGDAHVFVIVVGDTTRALQRIARHVRRRSGARVVAITGSIGKTTTKELTAALLATRYEVFRNRGNLNNHIGLPLSLLELGHGPDVAVVELGMNHAGEIRTLVEIAEPDVRVWTNVAAVHAAFFSSLDAIADAKAEICEGAGADTELIVNAADPLVMARAVGFPGRVTTFGVGVDADVRADAVRSHGLDGMEATVTTTKGSGTLRTPLVGAGHVANALAAIAVALRFQVPLDAMLPVLAASRPQPRRGEVLRLGDVTVVDDSYNSNPAALQVALEAVGRDPRYQRHVAVLGEMLELGDDAPELHTACGRAAVAAGFDLVVVVGDALADAIARGAVEAGLPPEAVVRCRTSEEAAVATSARVRAGDAVLVKGSRGIGTERVVDRLKAELS
jgi:UDP-N-acetylmuramoyl-tripeptide--D-alanyl-D-alanine ligase